MAHLRGITGQSIEICLLGISYIERAGTYSSIRITGKGTLWPGNWFFNKMNWSRRRSKHPMRYTKHNPKRKSRGCVCVVLTMPHVKCKMTGLMLDYCFALQKEYSCIQAIKLTLNQQMISTPHKMSR